MHKCIYAHCTYSRDRRMRWGVFFIGPDGTIVPSSGSLEVANWLSVQDLDHIDQYANIAAAIVHEHTQ